MHKHANKHHAAHNGIKSQLPVGQLVHHKLRTAVMVFSCADYQNDYLLPSSVHGVLVCVCNSLLRCPYYCTVLVFYYSQATFANTRPHKRCTMLTATSSGDCSSAATY